MKCWISILFFGLFLTSCGKQPLLNPPPPHPTTIIEPNGAVVAITPVPIRTPSPTPSLTPKITSVVSKIIPTPSPRPPVSTPAPILGNPEGPTLSRAGLNLIIEQEVDHPYKDSFPEAPDARLSGTTIGVGWDLHTNSINIFYSDWHELDTKSQTRLAATHPYYGASAQQHLHEVKDILIKWDIAYRVFTINDVAREFASCKRVYSGFTNLSLNCQSALISNSFNRGISMVGPNRTEMRDIRDYGVPNLDYHRIANDLRKSARVWYGTDIQHDMTQRRNAEAKLAETPD